MQAKAVARLCAEFSIPHVINNAYGVQSAALCARVSAACRVGRVDVVVQSTDKNFMVPVGGAVIAAPKAWPQVLRAMSQRYPGRAAVTAHLDLTMTLLWLGRQGWRAKLREREELAVYLQVCADGSAWAALSRLLYHAIRSVSASASYLKRLLLACSCADRSAAATSCTAILPLERFSLHHSCGEHLAPHGIRVNPDSSRALPDTTNPVSLACAGADGCGSSRAERAAPCLCQQPHLICHDS